jgi:hypothetical protein
LKRPEYRNGDALIVFFHFDLASMLSKVKDLGGMTKAFSISRVAAVFHFRAPGAG